MAANMTLFMTPEESERVRKQVQNRVEKCTQQIGQPREAEDPKGLVQQATSTSLMQEMSLAALGFGGPGKKSQDTITAYAVGRPYLPSTADTHDLRPMKVSELCMETHHRGRILALHRVSPVVELKASSWAAMQGQGPEDVVRLETFLHRSTLGKDILNAGSKFFIKEPYYTLSEQGEPTVRVDHPSDAIIAVQSEGPNSWRDVTDTDELEGKTPLECKDSGNAALQQKDYFKAHASYTKGLSSIAAISSSQDPLARDIHRNRSHVNLLLQRYDEAKADALASLTGKDDEDSKALDAKAYLRAANADYALANYDDAKRHYEKQLALQPDSQNAKINIRRVAARQEEKATGHYDMAKIVRSLTKTQGRPDVADFYGHTEVKKSPGAGRGLFATRAIDEREIIMGEKAFCVAWSHDTAFSALTIDVRDDAAIRVFPAGLHRAVVQKMMNNPSEMERVLDLFGDYEGLGGKGRLCEGNPVVDVFQVHDIVQRNAFSAGEQTDNEDVNNASTGLWVRVAHINHSCVPNVEKKAVGDFMVLSATRRINEGEEILLCYDENSDYDARTAAIQRTWGFKCRCALCAAEAEDGEEVRRHRRQLEEEADAFASSQNPQSAKNIMVSKARRLKQIIADTYDQERYEGLPRRALDTIEQWIKAAS